MNVFEMQASMAKAWLGLATSMTTMALEACATATRQAGQAWSDGMAAASGGYCKPSWPTYWPMMPNPGGVSVFPAIGQTGWPTPFTGLAMPQPAAAFPMLPWMGPASVTWPLPMGRVANPMFPWMAPAQAHNPAADLIDQVAASYRSVSGYAVAAVIGPMTTAGDRTAVGFPWWPAPSKRRDLN